MVNAKIRGLKELLTNQTWQPIAGQPDWEFCEFWHQCSTWDTTRRFVAVRQEKKKDLKEKRGELVEHKDYDDFC